MSVRFGLSCSLHSVCTVKNTRRIMTSPKNFIFWRVCAHPHVRSFAYVGRWGGVCVCLCVFDCGVSCVLWEYKIWWRIEESTRIIRITCGTELYTRCTTHRYTSPTYRFLFMVSISYEKDMDGYSMFSACTRVLCMFIDNSPCIWFES